MFLKFFTYCSSKLLVGTSFLLLLLPLHLLSKFLPNSNTTSYSLSWFIKYLEILVASPIKSGNTPVALGSNVPVCPTLEFVSFLLYKPHHAMYSLFLYLLKLFRSI